jgi:lipid II:glycine glycyltransferase (peptidoglycan interpeptide bridge formation enzyme)
LVDPCLRNGETAGLSYKVEHLPWFALDLTPSEDALFANMKDTGRRGIRKAIKSGVSIEEASDIGFADEYYAQYQEVMSNKSLSPTYELEIVQKIIEHIYPTSSLLLLRARNPDGLCIATALFLVFNKLAIFWGGASWNQYQSLHPNDLIIWYAMKILKSKGAHVLHLGGEAEQFKIKFGSTDAQLLRLRKAKNLLLDGLLDIATSSKSIRYRNWLLRRL